MLQVSGIKKSYGDRVLFEDVSFSVGSKEIVGFVGRNGSGKSTLFKILLKKEDSDEGQIILSKGYKIGALDQHIHFTENELLKECCLAIKEDPKLYSYKAEALLLGLGFEIEDFDKDPKSFSGGFQLRVNLIKALLTEPDLLLLDEPTNYLDILSLDWLADFLKAFPGEVMLITHDRHFMDRVSTHTMGLHRKKLRKIKGSTEKYYEQLLLDEEIFEKTRSNQQKKIKHMQDFVDRFGAKNTKAKQAQSKLKQIQKINVLGQLVQESQMGFRFNFHPTPAKILLTADNLNFGYKPDELLFQNLNFTIGPKQRIGVIGKNGKGKTTLLNVIAGQLESSGRLQPHPDLKMGYYQQTNKKNLQQKMSVYEEIYSENPNLSIGQVRAICGAMMFSGDNGDKKISVLSGGEQGRVLLGKVIAKSCNLLLLDEPTNHLDMESIQVMKNEIKEFPGGVLFVTHDEHMLRELATQLIIFNQGQAELFLGGYDEFLEKVGWEKPQPKKSKASKKNNKELKRLKAERIQEKSKKLKPIKAKIENLEKQIIEIEEEIEAHNKQISSFAPKSPEFKEAYKKLAPLQVKSMGLYQDMDTWIEKLNKIEEEYT